MKLDRFVDKLLDLLFGVGYCGTAGKIWNISSKAILPFFNYNHVSHSYFLRPACFRILWSVPIGISMLSLPATVTVPVFVG
jgi:hypothetical protein